VKKGFDRRLVYGRSPLTIRYHLQLYRIPTHGHGDSLTGLAQGHLFMIEEYLYRRSFL